MDNQKFKLQAFAVVGLLAAGCGGAPDDNAARLPPASVSPQSEVINITGPAEHLYFGVTNHLHVAGDLVADVNLNVGAQVQMEAVTSDGTPIRFELWMVHNDKHIELVNAFDVESGFVLTNIDDQTGDLRYVVHFPAPTAAHDVVVHMDCLRTNGRCTDDLQPSETCFATAGCAAGLLCAPSARACDPTWVGGTCVIPNDMTACATDGYAAVCGCDGVTYANACLATASGAGARTDGVCPAIVTASAH